MRIRAVLFDIDGTLLDSNDAQARAWLDSLRGHGINVPLEHLRSRIGMSASDVLRESADVDFTSTLGQSISERQALIFHAHYLSDVGPFHGARVLVDRLRSRGLICAAVSATGGDVGELLRAAGVVDLIDTVISADAPEDRIQTALERIGITPAEAIMIGDTPFDIDAAERVGVASIALRCGGGFSDEQLSGARAIYDDPAALSSQLDRSPLALDRESDPPPAPMRIRPARASLL